MISVETSFYARFPRWSSGAGRTFARPVIELLRKVTAEARVNDTLDKLTLTQGLDFVEQGLDLLGARYQVAHTDREHIPAEGRVVVVANHPLGAVDALALLHLVGSIRRDVKILANGVLMRLTGLGPLLLPCDVFGDGGKTALREAYRCLQRDEALIVFPAGEVSRIRPHGVRDCRWSAGFLRFARKTGAPLLPVHIAAHNSPAFYGMSMLAKPLGTLMLPREMFGAGCITLTVGAQIPPDALNDTGLDELPLARRVRSHVYRLARRQPPRFATSSAIALPESSQAIKRSLAGAERLGATSDGKQILLLDAAPGCAAMREIGRLREMAFRKVGEGTGLKRDLDRYDQWYRHIVLWDEAQLEIVGAYRLGDGKRILAERGIEGLYSASLFAYAEHARPFLEQGVELGRSFVQPRYWGSRSLDYLWQGIGAYLRHRPDVRYVFGPVSLSASLPEQARGWLVHAHAHYFGDPEQLAKARNPYRVDPAVACLADALWADRGSQAGLSELRLRLQTMRTAIPTLYRQYVDLCEPEGIRFLAFGVDPAFGHCVDGLIRLDLSQLKPVKRARYLSSEMPVGAGVLGVMPSAEANAAA